MEYVKLKDIVNSFSGGTPNTNNLKYYAGEIPFIGSGDIGKQKVEKFITNEALDNSSAKKIKKGNLLIAMYGATAGKIAISPIDGAINQAILCLIPKRDDNTLYLKYLLEKNIPNILKLYLQGGQGNLSSSIILDLKFSIHDVKTQNKISELLSSIDELIEIKEKYNINLSLAKKYYLKKVFEKQSSKINNAFKFVELGKVSKIKTGSKDLKDAKINGQYNFYVRSKKIESIDEYSYDGEAILLGGDGKIDDLLHYYNGKLNHHQRVYLITTDKVNCKYLYYSLQYGIGKHIIRTSAKTTVDSVRLPFLKNYPVKILDLEKQNLISSIFTKFDENIEINSSEITLLTIEKKYYLNNLFR